MTERYKSKTVIVQLFILLNMRFTAWTWISELCDSQLVPSNPSFKTRSSEEHNKECPLTWRPLTMTGRSPVFRSRKHASSFGASVNLYMTQ